MVDVAENGVNVYLVNKHYEVAPVLSMTEHEANNNFIWISDKLWKSLSDEQKKWVTTAADEVGRTQPAKSLDLEHQSADKLKAIGVKVVTDVDKSGFIKIAAPYKDKLAKELGPARGQDQGPDRRRQIAVGRTRRPPQPASRVLCSRSRWPMRIADKLVLQAAASSEVARVRSRSS